MMYNRHNWETVCFPYLENNLSNIRFQNTHIALQDCVEEMEYANSLEDFALSGDEFVAMQKMYHLCELFIQNHDFLTNN
jgi:hypothetical protein